MRRKKSHVGKVDAIPLKQGYNNCISVSRGIRMTSPYGVITALLLECKETLKFSLIPIVSYKSLTN